MVVREIRNFIERLVVMRRAETSDLADLPVDMVRH
jgi:DNA-binding NtrC family response regulator